MPRGRLTTLPDAPYLPLQWLQEAAMTRSEAIASLRTGLKGLPPGVPRTKAFNAFDHLVVAINADPKEGLVREAYHTLVLALPERRAAANRLLDDWSWRLDGAVPATFAARRTPRSE